MDNKTDTLKLWSIDRKNQYFIRDKTGNVPGLALSTPVFMIESPTIGNGEGNIAIKNLLYEVKDSGGSYSNLSNAIYTIQQNTAYPSITYTAPIGIGQPSTTTITGNINNTGGNMSTGQISVSGAIMGNEIYTELNMISSGYLWLGWAGSGLGANNTDYYTNISATGAITTSGPFSIGSNQTSTIINTSGITTYQPLIIKYPTIPNSYLFSNNYQSIGYNITGTINFPSATTLTTYTLGINLPYGVWGVSVNWILVANTAISTGTLQGMMGCGNNNTTSGSVNEGGSWLVNNTIAIFQNGSSRIYNGSAIINANATTTATVGGVINVPVMPYYIGYRAIGLAGADNVNVVINARAVRIA